MLIRKYVKFDIRQYYRLDSNTLAILLVYSIPSWLVLAKIEYKVLVALSKTSHEPV